MLRRQDRLNVIFLLDRGGGEIAEAHTQRKHKRCMHTHTHTLRKCRGEVLRSLRHHPMLLPLVSLCRAKVGTYVFTFHVLIECFSTGSFCTGGFCFSYFSEPSEDTERWGSGSSRALAGVSVSLQVLLLSTVFNFRCSEKWRWQGLGLAERDPTRPGPTRPDPVVSRMFRGASPPSSAQGVVVCGVTKVNNSEVCFGK